MDFVQLYTGIGRLDFWSYKLILAYAAWSVGAVFFWPAFAIAMMMAVILARYKETMLKKWMGRCFFANFKNSRSPEDYYVSLDEELIAFKAAVGGG